MRKPGTRTRILEAALRAFSERGYLGATTREIAGKAGVAELTLFRHFTSKEKLFEEVIRNYSFLPELRGLLPEMAGMTYKDALTVIAVRFLETLAARKEMIQIMHSEMHRYPGKIHRIYHDFIDGLIETLASYFATMQRKRALRAFDAEAGARAFLGMFFSYFNAQELMMGKRYRSVDTGTTVKEFVKLFIEGTAR
jgi:AcrR family transcriptional regulator